jgi:hypothetical protein
MCKLSTALPDASNGGGDAPVPALDALAEKKTIAALAIPAL